MGLASALSTALTGLTAAETTIDVVGNNLANASTVGFKASKAVFATQFLQTQSLGSQPTNFSGGTNPRQIGLGTQVAEIVPDFSTGTIEISANPSDLAIQGDGFFIVQGSSGETLYTRNGILKRNAQNELVTINGQRVLGYGVDENFQIQSTTLQPLTIPLGESAVAQATQNVYFEGTLSPTGDLGDTSRIIQSAVMGDAQFESPPTGTSLSVAIAPGNTTTTAVNAGGGAIAAGTYSYRVVFVDAQGNESAWASVPNVTVGAANSEVDLANIPVDAGGDYVGRRIYRSENLDNVPLGTEPEYALVGNLANNTATTFTDSAAAGTTAQNTTTLSGNYSYFVTYTAPGMEESRPAPLIGPVNVSGERLVLSDFPPPSDEYNVAGVQMRVYRNLATNSSAFYRVGEVNVGDSFVDARSDADIANAALAGFRSLDADGPKITSNTRLVDVLRRDGTTYANIFEEGTLVFNGKKGNRGVGSQEFEVTGTTTVQEWLTFVSSALGIQPPSNDGGNPIPTDISGQTPGGSVLSNGRLQFVSNTGVENGVDIPLSAFTLRPAGGGAVETPNLGFGATQQAKGESAVGDFLVYDSLGIALNVRVTVSMESRTGSSTTYRWFADSPDNDPLNGSNISVGTGLITFDGEGNVIDVSNDLVTIQRRNVASLSPLEFKLDFTQLSGLSTSTSTLSANRQDGSSAGTLTSYIIGEDGVIRGVFDNGVSRNLGQIRLASFANPAGLEQRGLNLFSQSVNSGLAVMGNPGEQGNGKIIAGALELSNTDIGKNLIDLILASTQYRGNTRVVTTAQQLLDELLALRR